LVVFSSGLLVVNVPHKDVALKVLNGALASADYSGIPCFPTTEWDMGSVELSETGTIVSSSGRAYPSRRGGTQRVGESALNEWLEFLRKTRIDEELLDQMQLRHGAEVYYDSGEYLAAFTLAWMVVEREIQRIWGATIDAKGIPPKRKLKLVRENEFNANQLVEVCQLLGKVNEQLYSEIQKLRRIRNDVVHRAVVPTQEQCGRCIATATTLLRERLLETGQ
jgi:bacterioferritin-associated ferredoxin